MPLFSGDRSRSFAPPDGTCSPQVHKWPSNYIYHRAKQDSGKDEQDKEGADDAPEQSLTQSPKEFRRCFQSLTS